MANERGQTFVVLHDCSEGDAVIFGRNSLKNGNEVPQVTFHQKAAGGGSQKCSAVEVEGADSFALILCGTVANKWGAESGSNENGVCVAVSWSANESPDTLLATDLVRLGLERSKTAAEAVDIITDLNEKYGSTKDGLESNKISLLICDSKEAWVLDIAGKCWAAEQITGGFRKLPSNFGVTTKIDKSSNNLQTKATDMGLWDGSGEFNFQTIFNPGSVTDNQWPCETEPKDFTLQNMFDLLRDKCPNQDSIKSSHVSTLCKSGLPCHWFTGTPNTSESVYKPFVFTPEARISTLTSVDEARDPNETLLVKYHGARDWGRVGELLKSLEATCVAEVKQVLASGGDLSELDELMKDCVESEVKFYR